jgi:hypothetical protein
MNPTINTTVAAVHPQTWRNKNHALKESVRLPGSRLVAPALSASCRNRQHSACFKRECACPCHRGGH